jgi:hypothetical protein
MAIPDSVLRMGLWRVRFGGQAKDIDTKAVVRDLVTVGKAGCQGGKCQSRAPPGPYL